MTPQPADGTAVILHLIEAARALKAASDFEVAHGAPLIPEMEALIGWVDQLEGFVEAARPAVEGAWEARTWGELCAGDRVSARGVEAEVMAPVIVLNWHVHPDEKKRRWVEGRGWVHPPLEHSQARVQLSFREEPYDFPPDGEVEVLRGEAGREADRLSGRGQDREIDPAERDALMEHWAEQAWQTVAAAGLEPREVTQ